MSRKSLINRSLATCRALGFAGWFAVAVTAHDSTLRIVSLCIATLYGLATVAWIWAVPEKAFEETDDQLEKERDERSRNR